MAMVLAAAFLALAGFPRQSDTIWIESEKPVSGNVKYGAGNPGHPEFLSGGAWLTVTGEVPADGARLSYHFSSPAGRREIWHRVGFEFARSPFEWRIDSGAWKLMAPSTPTTDLTELATWNGVAWMDMGAADLSGGDHTLEIHIPQPTGKEKNVLFGSDAFAIVAGTFHPNGKFRPGEAVPTDRDRAAASHVFEVAEKSELERQAIPLSGDWEVARDDELAPALVATPMHQISQSLNWSAISVPGDKAKSRPDLSLAHRVWYRTHFRVSPGAVDRSFQLTFRQNSLNTTVLVNGKPCGFNKNPFVNWTCDATPAVHAGDNELMVGIRDAWYGFHQDPADPAGIRSNFAFPGTNDHQGFLRLDYPVWACFASGMLDTPTLTVGGKTFTSDVFVKPSLQKKRLDADVTLSGHGNASVSLFVVEVAAGKVVKELGTTPVTLDGEKTITVGGSWDNPELWWPDHPKLYTLRTITSVDGKPVDVCDTPFGFREWTVDGPQYKLNGVVWHGWAELVQGDKPEAWLANYRRTGQRFQRMSGPSQNGGVNWLGMPYETALNWCDAKGVTIRRCGPLDGEAIGYMAIDDKGAVNRTLLDNVRDQIVAQVRGERNHPSINLWSIENEWLYINCINLYGGLMDDFESEELKILNAVQAVDPTRLPMADGGGAGKPSRFPVQGDHYVYTNEPNDYPSLAYETQPNGAGRGRWVYDGKRPRYAGEDYYATGINPADYAWIQGESAFESKAAAHKGMALVQRMITEGYRWSGVFTAFHLWIGDEGAEYPDKYAANAERAVFVRQYDSAFTGGATIVRTLGVFNDSHDPAPLTVAWSLAAGGKVLSKGSKAMTVPPGTNQKFDVSLPTSPVTQRTAATLSLSLVAAGKSCFSASKAMTLLPAPSAPAASFAVYDPGGTLAKYLTGHKVAFRPVGSLSALPADVSTLIVGPGALSEAESTNPALAAYAFDGHRVVVLEQTHPLQGAAIPTPLEPIAGGGSFGFAEAPSDPLFAGLRDDDFRAWPVGRLYERPYRKATRGVRSLVEVGSRLAQTALCEVPVGKGVLLLCQLQVGANLNGGGPARNLLANMIRFAQDYKLVERPVRVAAADSAFLKVVADTGVRHSVTIDPLAAIQGNGIAVVEATPENLHKLAANLTLVRAFTASGGSLVLHGLTPEGLADYNKIVGVEHVIRPFRREKTNLISPRDPLATGLTQGDVVMSSGEKMFGFNDDTFVANDIFSYIVDVDDVAPFATLPNDYFYNTVNGFVSADGWKYIFSFDLSKEKPVYTMTFPKAMTFRELTWIGNGFYHRVKKIGLSFDGGPVVPFDVAPNIEPLVLAIPPGHSGKSITLSLLEWTQDPGVQDVVGIDNIYLKVDRASDWHSKVRPLINVGGLVRYPQGRGNIVLANLLFKERESVPENAGKKRSIFATILRNLGAGFSGGANVVVPGSHGITYTPVSLAGRANAFRDDRLFGDKAHTLSGLPTGRQVFGSVPFEVYDFPTSPVPTVVMLGGPGVPRGLPDRVGDIKVGAKANALFFLQTARIDRPRDSNERRDAKEIELAHYVVTYADGSSVRVPIFEDLGVDDYRQKSPRDLPGARVAWSIDGVATVYMMQWTNPRPDVAIASVGLEYGAERRGVPVLIAVTAAH